MRMVEKDLKDAGRTCWKSLLQWLVQNRTWKGGIALCEQQTAKGLFIFFLQGRLPVKWMAPEALFDRVYTHQSDV